MTQPAADFVRDFFNRFAAHPDEVSRRNLLVALLDLELRRAQYNVFSDSVLFQINPNYLSDIALAKRILKLARNCDASDRYQFDDVQYYWLALLGHRLAAEHGFPVDGHEALRHVASMKLCLWLAETEAWSDDMLFEKFTETELRTEWDYSGNSFRYPRSVQPSEAT